MMMNKTNDARKKPTGQMIYNIVSAVAIIALFVLLFLKMGSSCTTQTNSVGDAQLKIAYINSDSLMEHYVLVDTMMAQLTRLSDSLDKDISTREQNFNAQVMAYQQNLQNGKIQTVDQAKAQEAALQQKQEELLSLRDEYLSQVAILRNDMNMQVIDSIQNIISTNEEIFPYDFVLGYTKGAGVLYASDQLDITEQVLDVLNKNIAE